MMVKLSLHSILQPPPSPWLNQRPRLDVNVGEYNHYLTTPMLNVT